MNLSKTITPKIIKEYCPLNKDGQTVTVLKDAAGFIGGYMITIPIGDTPVTYLDIEGEFLTSFYIFGTDEEKEKASKIIDSLLKRFPIIEPLACPN